MTETMTIHKLSSLAKNLTIFGLDRAQISVCGNKTEAMYRHINCGIFSYHIHRPLIAGIRPM